MLTINRYATMIDLFLLDIVDFKGILGMDFLSLYHDILGCHTKIVTLVMPSFPRFEWRGAHGHSVTP